MGLLKGVRLCRGAPEITHLMFADDCMFFLKAEKDSVKWIRDILRRYEDISGQKVNYAKSEAVCSKNTSPECIEMLRERMGIPVVGGHSSYLGLPLVFSNKKAEMLRSIEEKMVKRISDWKHKLLSGAGREVLVKSVLQAIPTYAMTCFKLPVGLCRELMRNIMRFWWYRGKNKGIHWVRAEEVYKDKENGGLGFRNLELMNMALLAKQGWRFIYSPHLLVSRIYKAKYFRDSDIFNASMGARPSYAWQGIYEALEILKLGTEWDENSRKFTWLLDSSGSLTAKSAYMAAMSLEKWRRGDRSEQSDPSETRKFWKAFWKLRVPNKVKFFGWRLFHDGLPTMQNLERRGCMLWLCDKLCKEEEFRNLVLALWLVWKNRNDIVHGKEGMRMEDLKMRLRWLGNDDRNGRRDLMWWYPDSDQEDKVIMCDGSFDVQARVAGAASVLIEGGKVQEVRAKWFDNATAVVQADCHAVLMGLQLAREMDLRKACLFTDSREVLWAINAGVWKTEACTEELKQCMRLLDEHSD
ncbi:hypothetical protein QQ045_022585 [Rhodiola kirilowii]